MGILYRGFVLLLTQLIASILSAFVFTVAYALTQSLWWLMVIHAGLPLTAVAAVLRQGRRCWADDVAEAAGCYQLM
jgi:hypothetical protein